MFDVTVLTVLTGARQILSKEENWTRNSYARDANGQIVSEQHPTATCFCTVGALRKATAIGMNPNYCEPYIVARQTVQSVLFNRANAARNKGQKPNAISVAGFNDHHLTTHADILTLLDDAILLAKG